MIRNALEIAPDNAVNLRTLAVILLNRKDDRAGAITALEHSLRADPDQAGCWRELGTLLIAEGRTDRAIEALETAVQRDPEHAETFVRLADAHQRREHHREAIHACRKALTIDGQRADAHYHLGLSLRRLGTFRSAAEAFRAAVRLDRKNLAGHLYLATALREAGDFDAALAAARAAVTAADHPDAHLVLGGIHFIRTEMDDAIASLNRALQLRNDHAGTLAKLGFCLRTKGRYAEALCMLRRSAALAGEGASGASLITKQIAECERLAVLAASLDGARPDIPAPASARDRTLLAEAAKAKGLFMIAVQLLAKDPSAAEAKERSDPYGRIAVLALAGSADTPAGATPEANRAWRERALALLRSELAGEEKKVVGASRSDRYAIRVRLACWQHDRDLAGVRDEKRLEALPPAERLSWIELWRRVAALAARAEHAIDEKDP